MAPASPTRAKARPLQAAMAGILGGVAMTLVQLLAALAFGMRPLELLLGSMLTESLGTAAWAVGLAVHLTAAAAFGVLYGGIFAALRRAGPWLGLLIGLLHGVVSGLVLAFLPLVHPLVPERIGAPGVFLLGYGPAASAAFFLLHLLFGAIVGDLCRRSFGFPRADAPAPRIGPSPSS